MSYPVSDPYIPDYADQEKDRLATMTSPLDDAKLVKRAREWAIVFGASENAAFEAPTKLMSDLADHLSSVLRENERLRKFAEDAALFSVDPNTVSDARAALDPIKPDEKD